VIVEYMKEQGQNLAALIDEKILAMLKANNVLVEQVRNGEYLLESETSRSFETLETTTRYKLSRKGEPIDEVVVKLRGGVL